MEGAANSQPPPDTVRRLHDTHTHTRVLTGKLSTSEKYGSVCVIQNKDHEIFKGRVLFNEPDTWSKFSATFISAELVRPCSLVKLCLNNIKHISKPTANIW